MSDKPKYYMCAMIVSIDERERIKAEASAVSLNVSDYLRLKTGL